MKTRLRGSERKSRFVDPACECTRYVTACAADVSRDPSRYTAAWLMSKTNPKRRVQRVCCRSGQQDEEREYFLHFKEKQKKHVLHNTGTRDVWWHKLWYAAMLLHCRHSQIAQSSHFLNSRQSSSVVAQRLTHSSHWVQTHVNQASRQEVCLSKRYKAGLPCTSCDVWGNTLSDVLNGC